MRQKIARLEYWAAKKSLDKLVRLKQQHATDISDWISLEGYDPDSGLIIVYVDTNCGRDNLKWLCGFFANA